MPHEPIGDFAELGLRAFTTTREAGSFSVSGSEPVGDVMARWAALRASVATESARFATASQVHGDRIVEHTGGWEGWLRVNAADGHLTRERGMAMAITIADCIPVFLAHPSGPAALLHAGWRGTETGILDRALDLLERDGLVLGDAVMHLGPGICGRCYEVSPDVHARLTGRVVSKPATVDLRALLSERARARGVERLTISRWCTRCDNDRFFSHRAGDPGRQLAVLVVPRR